MSKPLQIEVLLSHSERLPAVDVWLVVDILRATTVMVRWFELGGPDLYPTESVDAARHMADALKKKGETPLLMGEQNAIPPDGFDFGNSPLDLNRERIRGHSCAVIATTNGTKALLKASATGTPVLVACARNAFAALDLALSRGRKIGIFCSGRKGRAAWDDTLCAGLLIAFLVKQFPETLLADSARLALLSWSASKDFASSLATADHAVFLDKIGYGADIAFASEINAARSVPELYELPDGEGMRAVLREGAQARGPMVLDPGIVLEVTPEPLPVPILTHAQQALPSPAPESGMSSLVGNGMHIVMAGNGFRKHYRNKLKKL